ncbi:MAG: helix-turn-helix domain-containing protein [Spirochaetia bacterium]|nr:helix-turn-helix domain-containing protein [Spirochaetia bacterium]
MHPEYERENPIASFVRTKRKELGYTQKEFSLRCGVNLRFLKELEAGKPTVRLDRVNVVLAFFGYQAVPGEKDRSK